MDIFLCCDRNMAKARNTQGKIDLQEPASRGCLYMYRIEDKQRTQSDGLTQAHVCG